MGARLGTGAAVIFQNWRAVLCLQPVTWYDVLGVTRGASAVTLRRAHDERLLQLRSYFPAMATMAPDRPADGGLAGGRRAAVARPPSAVEEAWRVLGDPERRRRYDAWLGPHRAARRAADRA